MTKFVLFPGIQHQFMKVNQCSLPHYQNKGEKAMISVPQQIEEKQLLKFNSQS